MQLFEERSGVISVLPADNFVNHIVSEKLVLFCMVCYNVKKYDRQGKEDRSRENV